MSDQERFNEHHREYVSISDAYTGHLISGALATVGVGILYWIATFFLGQLRLPFLDACFFLLLVLALGELAVVLLQRPIVVKARHASPGGLLFALYEVVITPSIAFILALVFY